MTKPSDDELEQRLTPDQFRVTQQCGTEPAFTGCYWNEKREGMYKCVVCDAELFVSDTKYESGSGWPSFWQPIDANRIGEKSDLGSGMERIEVVCANCDAHLGHKFPDGPEPTGLRYCINSAALEFVLRDE